MKQNFRILSCIVAFNNKDKISNSIENQKSFRVPSNCVLDILIVDNSTDAKTANEVQSISSKSNVKYIKSQINEGVSGAYFIAAQITLNEDYDFLWLWDQDSEAPSETLETLVKSFEWEETKRSHYLTMTNGHGAWEPLGVVCPKLIDLTLVDTHWVFSTPPFEIYNLNKGRFSMERVESGEVSTNYFVNSGALISRSVFEKVGFPNKDFFMDLVDFEFSSRVKTAGFRILVNANVLVNHSVGTPQKFILLNRTIWARNYPAFRYYYQAKNELLMAKKSNTPLRAQLYSLKRLLAMPIKIYYDRQSVFTKILAHFLGVLHGLYGKTGVTHSNWMLK